MLEIKGVIRSVRTGRGQARAGKWGLGSVKALLSRLWELKASTRSDVPVVRQECIMNQALDEHGAHHFA